MGLAPERSSRAATEPELPAPSVTVTLGFGGPPLRRHRTTMSVVLLVGAAELSSYAPNAMPGLVEKEQVATCPAAKPGTTSKTRRSRALVTGRDLRKRRDRGLRMRHLDDEAA